MKPRMAGSLLAVWSASFSSNDTALVVPDGCRDLIGKTTVYGDMQWIVSPLHDKLESVSVIAGSRMIGVRIKPGVNIEEEQLLAAMPAHCSDINEIVCRVQSFTCINPSVEQALAALASERGSVARVAKQLGVSQRSLQRLLVRATGRAPVYWLMLARIRRAARAVLGSAPLIEIADRFGYADQAHMSRECRRWLGTSPSSLRHTQGLAAQLNDIGYD